MINLIGKMVLTSTPLISPHTQNLSPEIKKEKIIYITDHMPSIDDLRISVKGVPCYFKNTIIEKVKLLDINPSDKIFVFDHYLNFDDFKESGIFTGGFLCVAANYFLIHDTSWDTVPDFNITKKLTFMSNKSRDHRTLVSCLLANLFDLNEISYTYTAKTKNNIIDELLLGTDYKFDITKKLPNKWITLDNDKELDYGDWREYDYLNSDNYFNKLFDELYKNSAISIITEPNFFENGSILTEKTLMPIYSGHFLIWPGGWKAAETAKKLGLDTFDDIIDHSYQYIEHPGQRVVESILRNLELLNNIEKQASLRQQHKDRLDKNLKLVRNIPNLIDAIKILNTR
jgi:hypothetical protein